MATTWIDGQVVFALRDADDKVLASMLDDLDDDPPAPAGGTVVRHIHGWRFQVASLLDGTVGIFEASPADGVADPDVIPPTYRALLLPTDVLDEYRGEKWSNVHARFHDMCDIERTRLRTGLRYVLQSGVSAIFVPGMPVRITFVLLDDLVVASELVSSEVFAKHSASAKGITGPSARQRELWTRLHAEARKARESSPRLRPIVDGTRSVAPAPGPIVDSWTTVNRVREWGINTEVATRAVLSLREVDDIESLIGVVPDESFQQVEDGFRAHDTRRRAIEARRRAGAFSPLEIIELSRTSKVPEGIVTFEATLATLTQEQRRVVERAADTPLRLKGGPGTGKSLTALLRAGFLARRARDQLQPVRIGFFVFNADLGADVATRMQKYGLGDFLLPESPQRIVVTSLHEWCKRFVGLDTLGIEPLEPYRADRTQRDRQAALELAVEQARAKFAQQQYAELWRAFDTKSKHGLREIEMEISQFIKARDITDVAAYLSMRRPKNWWLADTDAAFKRFVWEVALIYNSVLRDLGFMDADDLTNDAAKEVSKVVWQTHQKLTQGFDYLILDEAQDFFRNQLTLIRQLVKSPEGLMMCFDESQAVYARYPSLRDLGFDSSTAFKLTRLEKNFRSSAAIVRALQAVASKYPTVGLQDNWGDFSADSSSGEGDRPVAAGFATLEGMLHQVADIVAASVAAGRQPADIAILGFSEVLLERVTKSLREAGQKVTLLDGAGRGGPKRAVVVGDARHAKGQQFDTVILVGVDRDSLPDLTDITNPLHAETKKEDDLRSFLVALSRAQRHVHLLWHGTDPSLFVLDLGDTVQRRE